MPLMVARHCSRVEKPQFLPPPSSPLYWAHQGYSIAARAGWREPAGMRLRQFLSQQYNALTLPERSRARFSSPHFLYTVNAAMH